MSNTIRGTVAELINKGLKINNQPLGQAEFSILSKLAGETFAKAVGLAERNGAAKGKRATIWEINPSALLNVTLG